MQDTLRQFKADIFGALAHPTRIAILEVLSVEEQTVGALTRKVGLEQANVSQHLAVLRAKRIVTGRKVGNQVFYALRDPLMGELLDLMRCYFEAHLEDAVLMLNEAKQGGGQ